MRGDSGRFPGRDGWAIGERDGSLTICGRFDGPRFSTGEFPEMRGDEGSELFPRIVGRLSDAEGPRDVDGELGAIWGREELGGDWMRGLDGAERDGAGDWIRGVDGAEERALGALERLLLGALRWTGGALR